ncbi:hypothetical protein ACFRMQ_02130 [Kitasatospora sp. NPDC056783]|uniref:hypothetical protein n=1 Tax=Kitasatospora sp. NPDC056783 TaxID=3345943 RepID=UPI0036C8C9EB
MSGRTSTGISVRDTALLRYAAFSSSATDSVVTAPVVTAPVATAPVVTRTSI